MKFRLVFLIFSILSIHISTFSLTYHAFGNDLFYDIDTTIIDAESEGERFTLSLASGDLNGDGYDDLIISDPGYYNYKGRVYIYFGSEQMSSSPSISFTGTTDASFFGISVSSGDVNGDGFDDVIVGQTRPYHGKTYVFYGGNQIDNIPDIILTGEYGDYGYCVSSGDLNGDNFFDVVVGAPTYSGYPGHYSNGGRVYFYYGGSPMDTQADGIYTSEGAGYQLGYSVSIGRGLFLVGAPNYNGFTGKGYDFGSNREFYEGHLQSTMFFGGSVSSGGDINGDGFEDAIFGAKGYGKCFVYLGSQISDNILDLTFGSTNLSSKFGISVSSRGDVDGDGYSDVIVGADEDLNIRGRVYMFLGSSNPDSIPDLVFENPNIYNYFGTTVYNGGDFDGDGYDDVVIGQVQYMGKGRAYVLTNIQERPILSSPSNNAIDISTQTTFKWRSFFSSPYYVFRLSLDSTFTNGVVIDTIYNDTSHVVTNLEKDKRYFWSVDGLDVNNVMRKSGIWKFNTIPAIKILARALFEGTYYQFFNLVSKRDTIRSYLRQSNSPYQIVDSCVSILDTLTFTTLLNFAEASPGTYYIVLRSVRGLETWSKQGGEVLTSSGSIHNYDFTTSASQAYGNNLKRKGSKYCIYTGDLNQSGFIDATELSMVENDAANFLTGRFVLTDLNGDEIVDASDYLIVDNNAYNFVGVIRP